MKAQTKHVAQSLLLHELADIRLGHPFRGSIKQYADGTVNVIQVRDTEATGEINHDSIVKTHLKTKKQPDWLQNGDVLFIAKGAKHHCVLVENIKEQTVCSPHFFLVRLKPEYRALISPNFLCWQLNQQPAQRYFKTTAEGSMYLSIRRQVLESVPIKLLEIEKQNRLTALHQCGVKEQKTLKKLIQNRQQQLEAIALQELGI